MAKKCALCVVKAIKIKKLKKKVHDLRVGIITYGIDKLLEKLRNHEPGILEGNAFNVSHAIKHMIEYVKSTECSCAEIQKKHKIASCWRCLFLSDLRYLGLWKEEK